MVYARYFKPNQPAKEVQSIVEKPFGYLSAVYDSEPLIQFLVAEQQRRDKILNEREITVLTFMPAIIAMIEQARQNALRSVNTELINLCWNVGEYLSAESANSAWGDAFIDESNKSRSSVYGHDTPRSPTVHCALSVSHG